MVKKLLLLTALVGGLGFFAWKSLCRGPPKVPVLDDAQWWGPKELVGKTDNTIRPFKVKFSDEMIKDLKSRLLSHRPLTPPLEGINMEYGINTKELEGYLQYWAKEYPFAEREKFFNQFPQFKTSVQGLDIHFIRVKPEVKAGVTVVPLLLLHGWPGSYREFYEAIPLLTTVRPGYNFVFEVVVPSLPGYGYSDPAVRPGLSSAHMGVIMRNLMSRLGHNKFYVQGGDWGSAIGSAMSTLYPEDILGYHTNFPLIVNNPCNTLKQFILGPYFPSLIDLDPKLADRMPTFSEYFAYLMEEFGYMHLHATKPDTVGVAVSDSPAGLAAYILEKFASWTIKKTPSMPKHLSKVGMIDNLMVYWVTNSMTTSMRLYSEGFTTKTREMRLDEIPTTVPTWALQAKHELSYLPPSILRTKFHNLLDATVVDKGGHFIAFELPAVLSDDVFKAVQAFRKWHVDQKTKKTEL